MTLTQETRIPFPIVVTASQVTGEATQIRSAELVDVDDLHRLYGEPQIVRNTSASPLARLDETRAWVEGALCDGHLLVATTGGRLAGALELHAQHHPALRHGGQISKVAVSAAFQGRGVASRLLAEALNLADNWLGLLRVELMVFAENGRAIALYRKHGFVEEGRLRGYGFRDGRFRDVIVMARLRGALAEAR